MRVMPVTEGSGGRPFVGNRRLQTAAGSASRRRALPATNVHKGGGLPHRAPREKARAIAAQRPPCSGANSVHRRGGRPHRAPREKALAIAAQRPPCSGYRLDSALQKPGGGRRRWLPAASPACSHRHTDYQGKRRQNPKRTRRKARELPRAHEHHPQEVAGGTSPAAATNTTRTEWGPSRKSARKTTGAKRHEGRSGESDASNDRWWAASRRGNGCESTHERLWRMAQRGQPVTPRAPQQPKTQRVRAHR